MTSVDPEGASCQAGIGSSDRLCKFYKLGKIHTSLQRQLGAVEAERTLELLGYLHVFPAPALGPLSCSA